MNVPYRGKFKVSQVYKGKTHKGIDLVGLTSKSIYSVCNGTVDAVRADTHPTGGFGLYIRIKEHGTNRYFYYAHLSQALVKPGQEVIVGTWIGVEGNTGNSTGSHLHFEIREELDNTTFVDPTPILGIPNKLGEYEYVIDDEVEILRGKLEEIRRIIER